MKPKRIPPINIQHNDVYKANIQNKETIIEHAEKWKEFRKEFPSIDLGLFEWDYIYETERYASIENIAVDVYPDDELFLIMEYILKHKDKITIFELVQLLDKTRSMLERLYPKIFKVWTEFKEENIEEE